jgi:mannose-6-phosphate isomerase-like protein (cupin superfamily)
MTPFDHAVLSLPGDGRSNVALGRRNLRIPGEATGGAFSVWDELVAPGQGAPPHMHAAHDELFQVMSGRFRIWCGDEQFEVGPGGYAALPRGVMHGFQNVGDVDGRLSVVMTPGGFEAFFLEVEQAQAQSDVVIKQIAARQGLTLLIDA